MQDVAKVYRPTVAAALDAGWQLWRHGNHVKLVDPAGGAPIPVPGTGNHGGLLRRIRHDLRRRGVPLDR